MLSQLPTSIPGTPLEFSLASGLFGLIFIATSLVYKLFFSPLKHIPGPFLAKFTRLWELHALLQGNFQRTMLKLHEQYGPVVRLAPNRVSFSSLEDVKKIYVAGGRFAKSEFYDAWTAPPSDNLLSIRDEKKHAQRKRLIAQLYSMSTVVHYESAVEEMNAVFFRKMEDFASLGKKVSLPTFCQFYAFDVIGQITWNGNFGMMENDRDPIGILRSVRQINTYSVHMGMVPELHPVIFKLMSAFPSNSAQNVVIKWINDAVATFRKDWVPDQSRGTSEPFLSKLLNLQEGDKIGDTSLLDPLHMNVVAGSDTTGISLSAIFYYLYSNPSKLAKLREEIDQSARENLVSDPITFTEAQKLPYFQAVVNETLRIHPAVSPILPRLVPAGGAELGGYYLPPNTAVGCSAWPVHYNEQAFDQPWQFRPERWLEDESKSKATPSTSFAFGGGSRVCIGRNISLLEISKVVPQFVRYFDLHIVDVQKQLETDVDWFVWPRYECYVEKRKY